MDSLIKCSIVPPEVDSSYAPPFDPIRNTCSVCRTCVLNSNTGECSHTTDEVTATTATWVPDEFRLAVQKGYRILEVHDVYEYNVTRNDLETREGVLFAGNMDISLIESRG